MARPGGSRSSQGAQGPEYAPSHLASIEGLQGFGSSSAELPGGCRDIGINRHK